MLLQCSGRAVTFFVSDFHLPKVRSFKYFFYSLCYVLQNGLGNHLNQNIHVSQTSSF